MCSFWQNLVVEILGAAVGAGIGGWVSYKITKYTLNKETGKEIAQLLLELRNNRQKLYDIYSQVIELRKMQLSPDEFKNHVRGIISNIGNAMQPVFSSWEERSSLIYMEYSEQDYIQIKNVVNQIDTIANEISSMNNKGQNSKVFVDLDKDAFANAIDVRYKETEQLFESITNKNIRSKLKIKR